MQYINIYKSSTFMSEVVLYTHKNIHTHRRHEMRLYVHVRVKITFAQNKKFEKINNNNKIERKI
jgi:hypothetical protein